MAADKLAGGVEDLHIGGFEHFGQDVESAGEGEDGAAVEAAWGEGQSHSGEQRAVLDDDVEAKISVAG